MSYSLPFRVLESLHRKSTAALWHENVENILLSKVPTTVTKDILQNLAPSSDRSRRQSLHLHRHEAKQP